MTSVRPRPRPRAAVLLALLALSSGCGDSATGPKPPAPTILYPGAVATGTIHSSADTASFTLVLDGGQGAMLYLMATNAQLRADVYDATGKLVTWTIDALNTTRPQERYTSIIPASSAQYSVRVHTFESAGPSDFRISVVAASEAPEHVPVALEVGTVVRGEDLAHTADIDSFTVTTTQDRLVNILLRKTVANPSVVAARLFAPGLVFTGVGISAGPADTVLGANASTRFTLLANQTYTIFVRYDLADTAHTGYELEVHPIDPGPESAKAAVAMGDTVNESIDYAGDIDTFTLAGTPGARFNLFLDAGGAAPRQVTASVGGLGLFSDPAVRAVPGGPPLAENALGVYALPSSGQVTITVHDANGQRAEYTGPYRFLVYPIDPRPEGSPDSLTLDQPMASRIDVLGDVDEFRLTLPTDTTLDVIAYPATTPERPLRLALLDAQRSVIAQRDLGDWYPDYPPVVLDSAGIGARRLPAGTYTVRVEPVGIDGVTGTPGSYLGDYRILARTSTSP